MPIDIIIIVLVFIFMVLKIFHLIVNICIGNKINLYNKNSKILKYLSCTVLSFGNKILQAVKYRF